MSGELRRGFSMDPSASGEGARKLANGRQSPTSPLKLFGLAKKKINDIFVEVANYIESCQRFSHGISAKEPIISQEYKDQLVSYVSKVQGIREILSRDRMKVAFFGRTSNGKSSVINAMLKTNILPTGIGHTTHCFLQVEGTDSDSAFLMTEDSDVPKNIQSVSQLASALSSVRLEAKSLLRICWPKSSCQLLKDDVVFVDSPGIDVSPDLDGWIDAFCLDADVFILVANAESTLMQTEKNFFHKVSAKLSKPNIFVLNNRWDASAYEAENIRQEVKAQHLERNIQFLVDEIKVSERAEAENRVFFVSAREVLISRLNQEKTSTPSGQLLDGFQGRLFEFSSFERKFQECISQTAVQTKFAQHAANGKLIITDVKAIMDNVALSAINKNEECRQLSVATRHKLQFTEDQINLLTTETKEKILAMTEEVERKVSTALLDEIRKLHFLVDEFDGQFHTDATFLQKYKQALHEHVEKSFEENLQLRCTVAFRTAVEFAQQEMTEKLTILVPEERHQEIVNVLPSREFEVAYRLDCRNLCADFQEDIEFHFSLGIVTLMNRFLGHKGRQHVLRGYEEVPHPLSMMTPQTPSNEASNRAPTDQESEMIVAVLGMFTSLYSRTTIGALAVTGLVAKTIGWRVIAICGAIYGLLYVYERMTWTNKAKERTFKRQYVDYATSKLKLILDLTSKNCAYQVQHELQSTFARLCRLVDNTRGDLEKDLRNLEVELNKLDEISKNAKSLRNKAAYLDTEINSFIQQYLKVESRL